LREILFAVTTPPPPGWYLDPVGSLRWWDGLQWGPSAPVQSEEQAGKTLGLVAHLGVLASGFPLPLVIRLTEARKNAFVRHHATEALNFQITFMIVWFALFGALFAVGATSSGDTAPTGVLVMFALLFALFAANLVLSILGCVRASQERWWRYPVSIRFVSGSRPRQR
jgi:uncharacterized Tic20 family protein